MPALLSRKSQKPKALLLGISYPSVEDQMETHGFDPDVLTLQEPSVDQAVECVRRGIFTEMDARDLARCVATEIAGDMDVYSVSKEIGAQYRSDRHLHANFNARKFCKKLQQSFGENIQFSQVILDYYWMPTGWLVTRWAKTLFSQTLPDLVRFNMLTYPSKRRATRRGELEVGVVYLPFCAHVTKEIVGAIDVLSEFYQVSFVKKQDLPGHCLWKGTMAIEADTMQHRLGKRLDQEEVYCTFRPKDIYENMEDSHVSKPAVMRILNAIVDYADVRMIMLRPLRQHEPPSLLKERLDTPEKGGFVGLDFSLPPHSKRYKIALNKVTPPDTPESTASATSASPEPKGPVTSKKKLQMTSKKQGPVSPKKKEPILSKKKTPAPVPVHLSKEKGPVYEMVEERPIPTKPMEIVDLAYYYSGPAPDLDTYFYKAKADMTPEEETPEEKPAPTPPKKPKRKPPVEDIWAVYNRLVHRPVRTTKRSLLAKKDLIIPAFDAVRVEVKREIKKSVVTDIEEVIQVPVSPEAIEEPEVMDEPRKEDTTFLKNRWYKEVNNEVDEKETSAKVVLKLPGIEEQQKLFDQVRDWEQEETELFQQNFVLDGARALFDINNRKKLKRITRKTYGNERRKEIVAYKIPKEAVLKLQEKNGQEMWPPKIDLFEPFQKAIECTRDFRVHWARFWDEKIREAYLAQREALFRETAKISAYDPHTLSVAEKRIKSMDTILEWLVCGHDSSVDPDGGIAAVYACLKKTQQQAPILTLTKTIERRLLKRKIDDYLEEAEEEVATAERKAAEAEQKVCGAETGEFTNGLYAGEADGTTKEMEATHQGDAEAEQSPDAAVAGHKAAETKQIVAEGLATLLAASVAQPLQLADRKEAEKAVLEPETDEDGKNLKKDIENWLLDPQDSKDSTGQFRIMDSRFPSEDNQDPSERASDMALKIRFLRNSYPDWLASMKAQDEDITRRSLATDWIELFRIAATLCSKKNTGVNAETATPKNEKAPAKKKASTSKKASGRKTAPTSKNLKRTSEEAPTSNKPESDGDDGTRCQSAKKNINKGKSCKRSQVDGQDSKKTKRIRRCAVEITPEGSANGDQAHSSLNPPIGVAPVSLASDSRFYNGPLDLVAQHAGMSQLHMPVRNEVLVQRQTPARHEITLAPYSTPAYQEGFVQLQSGGRPMFLTADTGTGGRQWHVSPETPLYSSNSPNRPRIPDDTWRY